MSEPYQITFTCTGARVLHHMFSFDDENNVVYFWGEDDVFDEPYDDGGKQA
jgi:hypothetical protein